MCIPLFGLSIFFMRKSLLLLKLNYITNNSYYPWLIVQIRRHLFFPNQSSDNITEVDTSGSLCSTRHPLLSFPSAGCLEIAERLTLSQDGYRPANGWLLCIIIGCFAFTEYKLESINKHSIATSPITGITGNKKGLTVVQAQIRGWH